MPIGIHLKEKDFSDHKIDILEGDSIYMFTDGYFDQIGGAKRKKFMSKAFKIVVFGEKFKSAFEICIPYGRSSISNSNSVILMEPLALNSVYFSSSRVDNLP